MRVVFDLDGTLSDDSHRGHLAEAGRWDEYHAASVKDQPVHMVCAIYRALVKWGHRVEIWTGRSDKYREQTIEWLRKHDMEDFYHLRMRPEGDWRAARELKGEWLDHCRGTGGNPDLVFDDRGPECAWWRSLGITCLQVADHNY